MIILEALPMDFYLFPAIAAIITAAISAYVAYQIAKRQHSGKIETSAAADLWTESRAIRETLRQQVDGLVADLALSHSERLAIKTELEGLKLALVEAEGSNKLLAAKLNTMREENEMLRGANLALARRVSELESKVVLQTGS